MQALFAFVGIKLRADDGTAAGAGFVPFMVLQKHRASAARGGSLERIGSHADTVAVGCSGGDSLPIRQRIHVQDHMTAFARILDQTGNVGLGNSFTAGKAHPDHFGQMGNRNADLAAHQRMRYVAIMGHPMQNLHHCLLGRFDWWHLPHFWEHATWSSRAIVRRNMERPWL